MRIKKRNTKRLTPILLSILLLASVLTGCGGGTSSNQNQQQDSAAPDDGQSAQSTQDQASETAVNPTASEPITLTFIRAGTDELTRAVYLELIKKYQTENPHITIDYQEYNFGDELETKMNTLYASGSAPDIVRAPISTLAKRAEMGQYASLDNYIDAWDEKDKVIPNAYDVGSYKGNRYGIAINIEARFLLYRKDHFIEAGLDPAEPPETWEELYEYAEKLTVREGSNVVRAGFSIPITPGHTVILPFARMNGGQVVDVENNAAVFNEPATVEALEYLSQFNRNGLLIPFIDSKDQNPFELGNASITIHSLPFYNSIIASGVDWADQLMFAPMPGRQSRSAFGGCQIMFISEESKYKDEAFDFLKFLFTDESVLKLMTETGASPVKAGLADTFLELYPDIGPTYMDAMTICDGMPKVEWAALFEKYINMAYEEAMYGQKDAQTALNDALQLLEAELQ